MKQPEFIGFQLDMGVGMTSDDRIAREFADRELHDLDAIFQDGHLVGGVGVEIMAREQPIDPGCLPLAGGGGLSFRPFETIGRNNRARLGREHLLPERPLL
jgi:hypothetical protein